MHWSISGGFVVLLMGVIISTITVERAGRDIAAPDIITQTDESKDINLFAVSERTSQASIQRALQMRQPARMRMGRKGGAMPHIDLGDGPFKLEIESTIEVFNPAKTFKSGAHDLDIAITDLGRQLSDAELDNLSIDLTRPFSEQDAKAMAQLLNRVIADHEASGPANSFLVDPVQRAKLNRKIEAEMLRVFENYLDGQAPQYENEPRLVR